MELKFENCLLISNDYEFVTNKLRESAKRLFDEAAAIPNSKAKESKMVPVNQQKDFVIPPEPEIHFHKGFNLGMCIPNGRLDLIDTCIIDSKKDFLDSILKDNDEIQKIEQELINADPSYTQQASNMTIVSLRRRADYKH
jgi:hypothetical protein